MIDNIYDKKFADMNLADAKNELREFYGELMCEMATDILILDMANRDEYNSCRLREIKNYIGIKEHMKTLGIWQNVWEEEFQNAKNGRDVNVSKLIKMLEGKIV